MGLGETEANCYLALPFPLRDLWVGAEARWVPPLASTQETQVSM